MRVHPRERGEATAVLTSAPVRWGPSPRARGSPNGGALSPAMRGSIPASAGKPLRSRLPGDDSGVHPRERGEAVPPGDPGERPAGPSPRARGSLGSCGIWRSAGGSIPASAGKPRPPGSETAAGRVHPRERGEAVPNPPARLWTTGPSPRARGSRRVMRVMSLPAGSIPASAGKPPSRSTRGRWSGVHPRERGEAAVRCGCRGGSSGPSPRARGSPSPAIGRRGRARSIPASAGKPGGGSLRAPDAEVHPRERGEAAEPARVQRDGTGPSPRARGSRIA